LNDAENAVLANSVKIFAFFPNMPIRSKVTIVLYEYTENNHSLYSPRKYSQIGIKLHLLYSKE